MKIHAPIIRCASSGPMSKWLDVLVIVVLATSAIRLAYRAQCIRPFDARHSIWPLAAQSFVPRTCRWCPSAESEENSAKGRVQREHSEKTAWKTLQDNEPEAAFPVRNFPT